MREVRPSSLSERKSDPQRVPVPGAYPAYPIVAPPSMTWVWARRLVMAALLAVALAYLPYRIYLRSGVSRLLSLQAELQHVRGENARLRKDNRRLRQELSRIKDGDADLAVEQVARDELGLIRPGEIVFKVVGPEPR